MFNPNVQIYIGDLKYNTDAHLFIESLEELQSIYLNGFDNRIAFVDCDYLGLHRTDIGRLLDCKKKIIITTLYPEKIDQKWECQIFHKEDWIQKNDPKIYELIKVIFHERDRKKVRRIMNENNISLFMINKWLQSNPTSKNLEGLNVGDKYLSLTSPDIWISLVSYLITDGPSYVNYKFKKNV